MTTQAPVPSPTSQERRARRQADASRALAAALSVANVSQVELAAACGVPAPHASEWANPEVNRNISVADIAGAPRAVRIEMAGHILGPGAIVGALPAPEVIEDDLKHAALIARGGAAVLETYLEALVDGVIVRAEAKMLRARILEQQRALVSLDASLALVEQQQVVRVRSLAPLRAVKER